MNKEFFIRALQFTVLILAQVLIFNKMGVGGSEEYVPYPYILFILLFPVNINKNIFLFLSFLLGLFLDIFSSSGGVHTVACTTIAFMRPGILKFSFGTSYEFNTIKFANTELGARLSYFSILVLVHHLILFLLETFNFSFILYSLKHTLFSSIYTLLLSILLLALFSKKKK